MQKKALISSIIAPLIIAKVFYILNGIVGQSSNSNPMGLLGNGESIWYVIIPVGVGLCGLFLTIFTAPFLIRSSFFDWKQDKASWMWELPFSFVVLIIGSYLNWPLSIVSFGTLPIGFLIYFVAMVGSLAAASKIRLKSSYFLVGALLLILPILVIVGLVMSSDGRVSM